MNTTTGRSLSDTELAAVSGGAAQPRHGTPSGFGLPSTITLPNGTVLKLEPPGPKPVIDVIPSVAGFMR